MARLIFPQENGSIFSADTRHVPASPAFGSFGGNERALVAWAAEKWNMLFEMKRGETQRMITNELYWAGFHYENAWDNRENPVTNYCFSTVETVWPILVQSRPRPEPVPRRFMDAEKLHRLRDFCTYKMDSTGYDRVFRMSVRELLKQGWCCPSIGWRAKGVSVPRFNSNFDFYPDTATNESELEIFAIARPVAVRRLRAMFPAVAERIQPDNIASPSYECLVKPYLEAASALGRFSAPVIAGTMPSTNLEGGTDFRGNPVTPNTTSGNYAVDTGSFNAYGNTAFLIQLFVRDYTQMKVRYDGMMNQPSPHGMLRYPKTIHRDEACCESGWRLISFLWSGVLLEPPRPVDPAVGIPVVIGRDYEEGGRFYARGELDDVIPIQRDINRTDQNIARALELQANPPIKVSLDARIGAEKGSLQAGELVRIARGAVLDYLQPQSLAESHFVRRASRRQDVQIVSGTPDSLQGQRPVGVEAAAAMRQLVDSATQRARAKSVGMLEWGAELLAKMVKADVKKSEDFIYYRAADGRDAWLDPDDYDVNDFDLRWAESSGNAQTEQDRQDMNLQLYQLGVIDGQQVLDDLDYPDRSNIMARVQMRQQAQAMAAASAGGGRSSNGGPPR